MGVARRKIICVVAGANTLNSLNVGKASLKRFTGHAEVLPGYLLNSGWTATGKA